MTHPEASKDGFTIIETIIVLGIAGFIFLIVLLMIPALNRNGHNHSRRLAVSAILDATGRYQVNHGGGFPPDNSYLGSGPNNYNVPLYGYQLSDVHINAPSPSTTAVTGKIQTADQIDIYSYFVCSSSTDATNVGAGSRDVVALFEVETASGLQPICQQL